MKTLEEIKKFDRFVFDKYEIDYSEKTLIVKYYYEIEGLKKFVHRIEFPASRINLNKRYIDKLVFNVGVLELVSYWKSTIAHNIVIKCGKLTEEQTEFFRKIYFYGEGEFFYTNGLQPDYDNFVEISSYGDIKDESAINDGEGNLVAIGGGKDSCVSLSLVDKNDSGCFIINPKSAMIDCAKVAGYNDEDIYVVKRTIDKGLLELNDQGFLNGHTPFSAMVAFVSYLTAYLNKKKYIILSNESSANESNVVGTKINHQYSKSYEFECDFQEYSKKYLGDGIKYYSLLRPLTEYQIGMIFARNKQYHKIFKSCNVGSKTIPWTWCTNCAKCLFVYSLLSPHLYKDELVNIFDEDMFENKNLLQMFKELLGKDNVKPFDCVGTFEEINYAITKTIKKLDGKSLPFLLDYYKSNYYDEEILKLDLEHYYNENNSLDSEMAKMIKDVINYD